MTSEPALSLPDFKEEPIMSDGTEKNLAFAFAAESKASARNATYIKRPSTTWSPNGKRIIMFARFADISAKITHRTNAPSVAQSRKNSIRCPDH